VRPETQDVADEGPHDGRRRLDRARSCRTFQNPSQGWDDVSRSTFRLFEREPPRPVCSTTRKIGISLSMVPEYSLHSHLRWAYPDSAQAAKGGGGGR
jgi:hypothetical protein